MIAVGISAINRPYPIGVNLQVGRTVYVDRGYTYTTVPSLVQGASYIQTANNDKASSGEGFLTFTLDQPSIVYVAYDIRINPKPQWLSAFADTGESLVTSDTTLQLFCQSFPAGPVSLGGNESSGKSMYAVIIKLRATIGEAMLTKKRSFQFEGRTWMYDTAPSVWTNGGTPDVIDSGLELMKRAGITDVLISCWLSGPTWHNPSIEPNHSSVHAYKWDAVQYYIEAAARLGISCHAVFTFGNRIGGYKPEYVSPGTPANTFDVFMPQYQKWLTANINECLERYPGFKGVSLDYTRVGGRLTGEPWASRFFQETGYDLDTCFLLRQNGGYYSDLNMVRNAILESSGIDIKLTLPGYNADNARRAIELYYKFVKYPIERFIGRVKAVMPDAMELSAYGVTHFPEWHDGRDLNGWVESGLIDTGLSLAAGLTPEQLQATKYGRRIDPEFFKFETVPSSNIALILRTYNGGDSNTTLKTASELQSEIETLKTIYPDLPSIGYYFLQGANTRWVTPELADVMRTIYD